ncbi:MAG: 16S rRNA (uracil(1498)-N(3))-methyltransferase [Eubacteriaceae bacterium]|nr:16S rRNA (uracil(1498)-N(3))-methyltransferase [Eubacteriaceae bacterium]
MGICCCQKAVGKSLQKFFVNKTDVDGIKNEIIISGENHAHLSKSLRMKIGENLLIADGEGQEYLCVISAISKHETLLNITDNVVNQTELDVKVTLYQGIAKGQKMETIIQKAVELGVFRIVPLITERTIVKLDEKNTKNERWNKISIEAAKQSKRGILPEVAKPVKLKELSNELKNNSLNIVAYESEKDKSLKSVFREHREVKHVGIIVGPEGGFSEEEIECLENMGVISASLGKRILRTETAGMALLSMIVYEYEL